MQVIIYVFCAWCLQERRQKDAAMSKAGKSIIYIFLNIKRIS